MAIPVKGAFVRALPGRGCLIVFGLIWSSVTLTVDVIWTWNVIRQIQAVDYPTVSGRVTQSDIEDQPGHRSTSYSPKIKYVYRVNGKQYTGDRYRYGEMSRSYSSARRIVSEYPVGRQIDIHYAAADPADPVLLTGLEGGDLFLPMFMTLFNLIMLSIWYVPFSKFGRRGSRVGNAKLLDDGFEARLRLLDFGPFVFGAGVAGVLAFFGTFIVGFGFGGNPELPVMYVAWGIILGGGALAFGWHRRRIADGQFDLVIDNFGRRLALPRTQGRKDAVVVDADHIVSVEVEQLSKRGSKGSTYFVYAPTLVVAESKDAVRREKVVEWSDEARSNELADWLRERLLKRTGSR
jgi:Protein of unknown function (DUF3592)